MKIMFLIVLCISGLIGLMYLLPQINHRDMPRGLIDGKLADDKPNWVSSSVAPTNSHYIAPLHFASLEQLSGCIKDKVPEVTITKSDASSLIGFRSSKVFHFVDWLIIHADGQVISTATMGYYDFGKNRELIEKIRAVCTK